MKRKIVAVLAISFLFMTPGLVKADEVRVPGAEAESGKAGQADEPVYYTIVKHDTLWDISKRFLKNPFKWPKIWKINPYIKNPDLIYPGNMVKITPDGFEIMTPKEAEADKLPVVGLEPEMKEPEKTVVLEAVPEQVKEKPAPAAAKVAGNALARKGFISEKELAAAGAIIGAKEKKLNMTRGDEVFISFKDRENVKPGSRYTIFAVEKKIIHPVRKTRIGDIVDILGSLRVKSSVDGVIEGEIEMSYKEIQPGAKLEIFREPVSEVEITKPDTVVNGYIAAALEDKGNLSKGDIAYIDRGTSDGLKKGNVMRIYRTRESVPDPLDKRKKIELPPIELGTLIVADPGDNTSACMILKSLKAINWGDQVSTGSPGEN